MPDKPTLSPTQNQIQELRNKGFTVKEIAEIMGIKYETVKTQIKRIKAKYRAHEQKVKEMEDVLTSLDEDELIQLKGRQQQALYLRKRGLNAKEAAIVLGISASTVRQYNYRSSKKKHSKSVKKYILTDEELQEVICRTEEKNKPVPRDIISMTYNIVVKNERSSIEDLKCLAISGCCTDRDAKSILLSQRAKSFLALKEKTLTYIEKDDLAILSDVVSEFFKRVKDDTFKPKTDKAQEILEYTYKERKQILDNSDGIIIRKTNDGAPGKAYAMQINNETVCQQAKSEIGRVVGIKKNAVIVRANEKIVEINTDKVTIYHKKSYTISCEALREGDIVSYNCKSETIILNAFDEDVWPVKIIEKSSRNKLSENM